MRYIVLGKTPIWPHRKIDWGVSKPDPAFFRSLIASVPNESNEILYVGDRLDNDIQPAAQAGMKTALVRRGPWA